jgi:hypothetical protein
MKPFPTLGYNIPDSINQVTEGTYFEIGFPSPPFIDPIGSLTCSLLNQADNSAAAAFFMIDWPNKIYGTVPNIATFTYDLILKCNDIQS